MRYYEYKIINAKARKMSDEEVILLAARYLNNDFNFGNYEQLHPNSKIKHSTVENYLRSRLKGINYQLFEMIDKKIKKETNL